MDVVFSAIIFNWLSVYLDGFERERVPFFLIKQWLW